MSIMVGVGRGAQAGVLIKNAEALERMEKVDTLVIDKTGTLTEGKPKVTAIVPAPGVDEAEAIAAGGEPRARERASAWRLPSWRPRTERNIALAKVLGFDAPAGKGVFGMVERRRVMLGNEPFLSELGIATAALEADAERLRQDGATAIYVAIDGKLAGVIAVADPVKPTTPAALDALRQEGLRVVMLTGDNRTTAQAVAQRLRHRRGRGRGTARAQGRGHRAPAAGRPRRGHGGRWHQ